MIVTYRDASVEDAGLVTALFRDSFVETFAHLYHTEDLAAFLSDATEDVWREEIADPQMSIRIAFAAGRPAGFARVGPGTLPIQRKGRSVELRQLYLLQPWQGQGIAAGLMEWAVSEARARHAEHLYLSVYVDNHRARRFYERYGFVEEGPYTFMVGNHADEDIVMRLDL